MYALIENGSITRTTNDLRKEFPNTSFPKTLPDSHEGFVKVTGDQPAPPAGQKLLETNIIMEDGVPVFSYTYEDIPDSYWEGVLYSYRDERRRGGVPITVGQNTISVPTTVESLTLLNGATTRALVDNDLTKEYKFFPPGLPEVTMTNAQFIALGVAASNHEENCLQAANNVHGRGYSTFTTEQSVKDAFDTEYGAL